MSLLFVHVENAQVPVFHGQLSSKECESDHQYKLFVKQLECGWDPSCPLSKEALFSHNNHMGGCIYFSLFSRSCTNANDQGFHVWPDPGKVIK
jgi:hypothetical protein